MNQPLVKMMFGSQVYGTNLPTSDRDFKGVFIPDAQELVMQRAAKHIRNSTKKDDSKRNTSADVDDELFSFQTYMELIRQGQTVALDMLFTPERFYCSDVPVSLFWQEIVDNRQKLIHKGTNAFVGYTKAQAAKYGHKGDRLSALNLFMNVSKDWNGHKELGEYEWTIKTIVEQLGSKEAEIVSIPAPNGSSGEMKDLLHLSLANKKVGFTCTVDYARQVWKLALDKYGHRAKLAESNDGVDWKATMHAVRIASEAEELLLTGAITFPRPEAELLVKIRTGQIPYKEVEQYIEDGLVKIKDAELRSTLSDKPNFSLMDELVSNAHWSAIKSHSPLNRR